MNREQPSVLRGVLQPLIYAATVVGYKKNSREMSLSRDGLHFRDQRFDISYRFNFGYYFFNIYKVRFFKNQLLWLITDFVHVFF